MNDNQRLSLALALTLVILFGWTLWMPKPTPVTTTSPEITSSTDRVIVKTNQGQERETARETTIGPCVIGVGESSGGILSLRIGEDLLIEKANPIFLEVLEDVGDGAWVPLKFSVETSAPSEISAVAISKQGLRTRRSLRWAEDVHRNFFTGVVKLYNPNGVTEKGRFRIGIYQTLSAHNAQDQRYLMGTAWIGSKEERIHAPLGQSKRFTEPPTWVVSQNKTEAMIVEPPRLNGGVFHVEHSSGNGTSGWFETPPLQMAPGSETKFELKVYIGPMVLSELSKLGMEQTLSFGAFSGITRWLLRFLNWGQQKFHNYGWAILLLSISVWLPFSPLTWYGMKIGQKTTERMALLKPQEARIRREQADNPAKMQHELMALYRKHGVNPAAGCIGCLPFLLTWPIYIALFQVLNRAPELRGATFLIIRDLAAPDGLIRFPQALPLVGMQLNVLPFILSGFMMVQQKTMQRPQVAMSEEQKIQQQMFKIFPLMFLVMFYNLPAGFMLYWLTNSMLMTGQQMLLSRIPNR